MASGAAFQRGRHQGHARGPVPVKAAPPPPSERRPARSPCRMFTRQRVIINRVPPDRGGPLSELANGRPARRSAAFADAITKVDKGTHPSRLAGSKTQSLRHQLTVVLGSAAATADRPRHLQIRADAMRNLIGLPTQRNRPVFAIVETNAARLALVSQSHQRLTHTSSRVSLNRTSHVDGAIRGSAVQSRHKEHPFDTCSQTPRRHVLAQGQRTPPLRNQTALQNSANVSSSVKQVHQTPS